MGILTVAIPIWPNKRLLVGMHLIGLKEPKLAIHSNITPGKLGPESEHILMLDYDDSDGWTEEKIISRLAICGITSYFLYRTQHGWHVIDCTRRTWGEMLTFQIDCRDHDLHMRKTAQYGRAALALHPPGEYTISTTTPSPETQAMEHYVLLKFWFFSGGDMETLRAELLRGDIAFRFYRKYTFIKKVF